MILETERLILRDFTRDDWKAVHVYASDADLVQHMEWGPNQEIATIDYVDRMLMSQNQYPREQYELAITVKENGTLIGGCGLHIEKHSQAALGYCLNRQFWGKGYTTEAAHAMCRFGFFDIKLHRIFATCRPENIASSRVMEKIGMTKEGTLREHLFFKGRWHNSFIYSILTTEFV
ncbi:GNAT family N-acetyltransferase [Paenibacillus montanisoli]|uniref:N-acetyltransferase n=1 Tax=Paenibacillus montanisoli TaxID=2081970 RepID=A0A328U3T4_9BACL|nr:GNAT family protein [Paenibacillus montanisoli]RAP76121.1 N-acetyltransferase [Paenibacillus montanisoli]